MSDSSADPPGSGSGGSSEDADPSNNAKSPDNANPPDGANPPDARSAKQGRRPDGAKSPDGGKPAEKAGPPEKGGPPEKPRPPESAKAAGVTKSEEDAKASERVRPDVAQAETAEIAAARAEMARAARRRRLLRRTLIAVGAALVLVAAVVGIGGKLLINRYDHAVNRDVLLAPSARAQHGSVRGPLNLLLIGSDLRSGDPGAGQRSDTIIVAHVNRAMDRVFLISIPRDLLVDIPPVPSMNFGGDTTKINAAFEYGRGGAGGVQLVSATLTNLLGIRFDGAAVIDFSGLRSAVDILNGVNMCVDERVVSIHTGKVFEPGCRLMTSGDVLDYLRQRNFPDGDYTRQRHQQQFLKAFLDRARSTGAASNPVKMDALLRAVAGTMTVDTGETALTDLVFALRDMGPGNMSGVKIPSYPDTIDDVSYVVAAPEAMGLFSAIRSDGVEHWAEANQQWVNKI